MLPLWLIILIPALGVLILAFLTLLLYILTRRRRRHRRRTHHTSPILPTRSVSPNYQLNPLRLSTHSILPSLPYLSQTEAEETERGRRSFESTVPVPPPRSHSKSARMRRIAETEMIDSASEGLNEWEAAGLEGGRDEEGGREDEPVTWHDLYAEEWISVKSLPSIRRIRRAGTLPTRGSRNRSQNLTRSISAPPMYRRKWTAKDKLSVLCAELQRVSAIGFGQD
ncbi:uncharacterized protein SPPG_01893 [Spizellomyces punctatus DAOM BR117]|uniref:Uncharacterized protein n=1 Tax=Spizellomyces punctatus (strain DAOM BR117) TaxID=645134 RepID=A0A0L0HNZ3_SPIPD|nr:uncharacterized protein SPPG_01893 [Spizellomyces punctatus DAOM BR117]KND02812.1 hypothetical protein SPPG_01893 [Spizellomyces punctatus DAOM BR117]|eukprot:XP_016610851.1 hypothetical protein SPPG_01893 [Spizellomyces punctatus DAOM BR117]